MREDRLPSRSSAGFTLIELMVVVAIIAFVSAAMVPSFSLSLLRGRQREAAMLVIEGVLNARSRAARTGFCHRVRVAPDNPVLGGGNGGVVVVEESIISECSRAENADQWTVVAVKSVGGGSGIEGETRAGLVGQDVAISGWTTATPMLFEPSGGFFLNDPVAREFTISMYRSDGMTMNLDRRVTVSLGGSVRYVD